MSYRRAWLLVDALNALFGRPVVETAAGGERGGGASLTEVGHMVVDHYDALMAATHAATHDQVAALASLIKT